MRGRRHREAATLRADERGQTTLDFAIGVSVFILVTVLVLSFAPGIIEPFTATQQEDVVISDRVADQLATSMLGDPADPFDLSVQCTEAFFNTSISSTDCEFTNTIPVRDRIGVSDRNGLNVTVWNGTTASRTVACLTAAGTVVEPSQSDCRSELTTGTVPPDRSSVAISQRVAQLGNRTVRVTVRVW